jgi:hypothetical protein
VTTLERKAELRDQFEDLVRALVAERAARAGRTLKNRPPRRRIAANTGRGAWMRSSNTLHRSHVAGAMRSLSRRLNAKRMTGE